jgi:hypothetical protein
MCKCCSGGKHASKYKQFEFLHDHAHSHEGVTHSHEPDHEHHHPHLENPEVMGSHEHGEKQDAQEK